MREGRAFCTLNREAMAGILFEDIFDVKDIDPDGKKFERGACHVRCLV